MISTGFPQEATRAACHSEELMALAEVAIDCAAEFARFSARLCEAAGPVFAALCDAREAVADIEPGEQIVAADWQAAASSASLHASYTFGKDRGGIVVSTGVSDLVAQFERILGGTGEIDEEYEVLPASAAHFARQFESRMCAVLGAAFDCEAPDLSASTDDVADIGCFEASDTVWTATLSVALKDAAQPWKIRFAVAEVALAKMGGTPTSRPGPRRTIGELGLAGSAIADIALPLRAVLVDVPISLSRVSRIVPGATIPVPIHRNVPVQIGETTIGHGTVGEVDDRVALEMTQTSLSKEF